MQSIHPLDLLIIAVEIRQYKTLKSQEELLSAPVDKLSLRGYVSSTPKSKATADMEIKQNPQKKQIAIERTLIWNGKTINVIREKIKDNTQISINISL